MKDLENHEKIHMVERTHKCHFCEKMFNDFGHYKNHERTHKSEYTDFINKLMEIHD